ncbi:MAG: ABC transporter permease subunit [Pseudohongiellaceae bacterium]
MMMEGFITAFKAELYVSLRNLGSKIVVLAPSVIVVAGFVLTRLTQAGEEARESLLGGGNFADQLAANNAYGHLVDGLGTGLILLGFILVTVAAHSLAYDRDTGLIRHLLIRRISRPALLLAKLAHLHLLALISLVLLFVVSVAAAGMFWEYGPIVEDGFELIGSEEMRNEIRLGLILALLPLPATLAFGLLISVLSTSATQAVTSALGATLALDIFKPLLGDAVNYLYVAFQPSLVDQSYLNEVSRIVRGYSDVLIDERTLQLNYWVPLPEMVVLVVLALAVIAKRKM